MLVEGNGWKGSGLLMSWVEEAASVRDKPYRAFLCWVPSESSLDSSCDPPLRVLQCSATSTSRVRGRPENVPLVLFLSSSPGVWLIEPASHKVEWWSHSAPSWRGWRFRSLLVVHRDTGFCRTRWASGCDKAEAKPYNWAHDMCDIAARDRQYHRPFSFFPVSLFHLCDLEAQRWVAFLERGEETNVRYDLDDQVKWQLH